MTSDFVLDLVKSCGLDLTSAFIRISLDGGGSFFKVIINVFDCEEKNGVNRLQFLAIVEDIPESNCNLSSESKSGFRNFGIPKFRHILNF